MYKLKNKLSFTLAEVLTVLGIIGIVATLALPNLNNNVGSQIDVAKVKKIYSEFYTAWDRAMIKNSVTNATNVTAANIAGTLRSYMKVIGTGETYVLSILSDNNDCKATATLLRDGSAFCVAKYTESNTPYFNIAIDIDGPNNGDNTLGSDIYYASLTFPAGQINPPSMEPFAQTSSLSTSASLIVKDGSPDMNSALLWIMTNDNADYNKCAVKWISSTTCR